MKKTLLTLATICLASAQVLFAQSRTVKGTVLDENGEPLYYATVTVKHNGQEVSTTTDESGNYELVVPDGAENIVISYDGYNSQTKKITEETESIQLTYGANAKGVETLGDVNISAPYQGSLTKVKFVGAGDRIGSDKIGKMPISNFTRALEANAPGVMVTNASGQPGSSSSIRIRGFSSLNGSNDPLIVLDGAPYMGSYNSINPNDIESMDVLKDATATSLYGSRGANGVILITTKTGGKNKRTSINVDAQVGVVQRAIPNYDVITDPKEYYEFAFDAYRNKLISGGVHDSVARKIAAGLDPNGESLVSVLGGYNSYDVPDNELLDINGKLNPNAKLKYNDLWDKEMQRLGIRQNYTVSASGGSQTSDFYLSMGYLNEKSYMKHSDLERFNARTNLRTQINDWLKAGINISANYGVSNFMSSLNSTAPGANPFYASRSFAPIYPVYYYNAQGQREIDPYTGKDKYDWGAFATLPNSSIGTRPTGPNMNVLGSMDLDENSSRTANITAIPSLEAKFLKNFTFRTLFSTTYYNQNSTGYTNPFYGSGEPFNGSISKSNINQLDYTFNQVLTWNKTINQYHGLDFLVAHESYYLNQYTLSASRRGVANTTVPDLTGAPVAVGASSNTNADRMESYIGQVNYNYKGKYFATANIRRDGSSRFNPSNRWGNFWSIGGGWILSQENFIKDNVSWLSNLKLKASYGTQGSNSSGLYAWQGLANIDYPNGGNPGALIVSLPNDSLTWESQTSFNAGVEFSIKNSVRGEINYFSRQGLDQLFNRPLALSTGIASRWENVMSTRNSGVEVNLYFSVINNPKSKFTWLMDVNATHFKNTITELPDGVDSIISGNFMYKVGQSYYDYYMVRNGGVKQSTGEEQYWGKTADGQDTLHTDYNIAVQSGGRDYVATSIPTLQGGFNNSFGYKGFDLNIGISYSIGGKYYDGAYQGLMGSAIRYGSNVHRDWLEDRWTEENKSGTLPKAQFDDLYTAQTSDRFLISRSYLNIRNVNLGYTFSPSILRSAKIQSLRVYLAADNLWLFTKRQGMDPQANFSGGTSTAGSAYGFTTSRTITFGINIGL